MMPTVGNVQLSPGDKNNTSTGYRSRFNHKNESASPGYYSVLLDDYNVKVELTSTLRAGFHKYTFPETDHAHIILDLTFPYGDAEELIIKKVSDTEIEGLRRSHGLKYYKKIGYLPYDRQGESASKTLEYSYNDWCISQMAKEIGSSFQ